MRVYLSLSLLCLKMLETMLFLTLELSLASWCMKLCVEVYLFPETKYRKTCH